MTNTSDGSLSVSETPEERPAFQRKIKRVAAASTVALVVGQVISLGQTVVLARLLTPTEVGIFAAGTVLTAFLSDMTESGLRASLVQREHRLADAAETVFRGTAVTGLLTSIAALLAAPIIGLVFDSATAGMVAAVCSGSLFLHALTNVPEAMLQRQFSVKRRLLVGPLVGTGFAATAVTLAALGFGVWSLVIGSYVSYVVWLVTLYAISDWRPGRGRASWQMWRELVRYGFPVVLSFVGARLQQVVESVTVGRALSTTDLGYYRYATRISRIPVSAIIDVVANGLFPAFSRMAGDAERLRNSYVKALGSVTLFAVVVSGLLVTLGEPAVVVLLGEPWRGAGAAVVAMAGLGLGKAFTCVSEEAIKGCGRTTLLNWMTGVELSLGIAGLALIFPLGLFGVGLAISITAMAVGLTGLHLCRAAVGVSYPQIVRVVVPPIVAGVVATVAVWALEHGVLHSDTHGIVVGLALLALDGAAFLVVYLAALTVVARPMLRTIVVPLVAGKLRRRPPS